MPRLKTRAKSEPKAKRAKATGDGGSILTYAPPGYVLRPGQVEALLQIENNYDKADVFVLDMPVSAGKSLVAVTIARWLYGARGVKSTIAVPNNLLLKQYTEEFSWLTTLKAQRTYTCVEYGKQTKKFNCGEHKKFTGSFCSPRDCCYLKDVRKANVMPTGVYNYHTLLAYKMFREAQIFDESHNVIQVLREAAGKKLWKHVYHYPDWVRTYGQLHRWVSENPMLETDAKLKLLKEELESSKTSYLVERTEEPYHGEMRDLIKLNPVDVSDYPPMLWPEKKTKKLFFMSATMNVRDVRDLGLDRRRVMTISTRSPIPAERRPCIVDTRFNMSYHNQERELPRVALELVKFLSENPERGFIHAPYGLASKLKEALALVPDPDGVLGRVMFHSSGSKISQLDIYKETPGAVLVASGMYEGVSLNDDLARWQILLKVPWPSLAEPAIKWKAENDEEWYLNHTVRDISQMYGRVCRHEGDVGSTIIWDSSFKRLQSRAEYLFPPWFKEALTIK